VELTESLKAFYKATADRLRGAVRRAFIAGVVKELGYGGQSRARKELGWADGTIRKGLREQASGMVCVDAFNLRGRWPAEKRLPNLLVDIKAIVDGQSQTDPQFRNQRLYTRLSVEEVRRQLIEQKGYTDEELPQRESLRTRLNKMGFYPRTVAKTRPKRKIPQTNAIFERLAEVTAQADADPTVLRLSMDAKATVKVGEFSRDGVSRVSTQALDHDFHPETQVTPVGILLPKHDEFYLFAVTSKVTSDCLVDCLERFWSAQQARFPCVSTLLLNLANGPECNSHRT
jgi:hypothetical protein